MNNIDDDYLELDNYLGLDDDNEISIDPPKPSKSTKQRNNSLTNLKNHSNKSSKDKAVQLSLSKDGTRSTKHKSLSMEPVSSASSAKTQGSKLYVENQDKNQPSLMACDKLELNIQLTRENLEWVLINAQQLVKDGRLVKVTKKSRFYKHVFKLTFGSGAVAVFRMVPNLPKMKNAIQLVFNPNPSHMDKADALLLRSTWIGLFTQNALSLAKTMTISRVDVCADFQQDLDELIIDMDGARVGTRFGVKTKLGGKIQSIYMGGVESAHHGVAYNQGDSDRYKESVGEVTRRRSLRQDADIAFDSLKEGFRIESRRLFEKPLSFAELFDLKDIFGRYKVFIVKRRPGVTLSVEFLHYLDCVRLRGLNGAKSFSLNSSTDRPKALEQIASHEKKLLRMLAPWWRPQEYNANFLTILKASPAWYFLRVMENP